MVESKLEFSICWPLPRLSTVILAIDMRPNASNLFLKTWLPNDDVKPYPPRQGLKKPGPIDVNGAEEIFVHAIIEVYRAPKIGRGYHFLLRFKGLGPEDDRWNSGHDLQELKQRGPATALEIYYNKLEEPPLQ